MPLGQGLGFWAVTLPVEKTNLALNASFEYGTIGAVAIQSATLGSSSQFQQYGAWSCSITPDANGTSGGAFGTWTAGNGSAYTVSMYARLANGVGYRLAVADSSGVNFVSGGTTTFTGGGTWARYSLSYTEPSGAVRRAVLTKSGAADTTAIYVDGYQIEAGSVTSYCDGDQPGCVWNGAPHASTATRSAQSRAGGSLVALADLGWQVDQMPGVGMPSLENSAESYAVLDGAQYQRTRAGARSFTLTAKPIVGTTTQDFHITRRTIIDALKIDSVTPQQPTRFVYVGGQGTVQIDAVYDHGFELGAMDGPMAESFAAAFVAYDPYFAAPTQEGTTLGAYNTFGSANWAVSRDPIGRWGTLGPAGTSTSGEIRALAIGTDQKVLAGGSFRLAGGTASGNLALYDPPTNTWGSFPGGTISAGFVYDIGLFTNGTILVVGSFQSLGGTNARNIGYWAGANFGSYGGTANGQVNTTAINATGTAFLGGQFTTMGGTTAPNLALLANSVFGTLIGGTVSDQVYATTIGLDQSLYFGGIFTVAGGTTVGAIARWRAGSFGTMGAGILTSSVLTMNTMLDGKIAIGGQFGSISGAVSPNIAVWNGAGMQALAQGVGGPSLSPPSSVYASMVDQDNSLYVSGFSTYAGSVILPDAVAKYVGGAFVPLDITLGPGVGVGFGGSTIIYSMAQSPTGTIYLGGDFSGSAIYATVAQVVNRGRAIAYPTIRFRNLSSGTVRITDVLNTTTGDSIYFNLALQSQEVAVLTLAPTQRSFTSSFRGNIFGAIIPGSNLATWGLLAGTNMVSFFADNASLETAIYWTPRAWSADGGTVY